MIDLGLEFFTEALQKVVPGLQVVTVRRNYAVDMARTRLSLDCVIDDIALAVLGEQQVEPDDQLIERLRLKVQEKYQNQRDVLLEFVEFFVHHLYHDTRKVNQTVTEAVQEGRAWVGEFLHGKGVPRE